MRGNMVAHWIMYCMGLHRASTQLTEGETESLLSLAQDKKCIVELGVFEGATSRRLREVMSPTGSLWCIDPFYSGSFGFSYGYSIAKREVKRSANGRVRFIRKFSYEAVKEWQKPVDLVFIDADHAYEAVKKDWFDWLVHVVPGGVIALHDSRMCAGKRHSENTGPVRLVREIVSKDDRFQLVNETDTLTAWQKI